MEDQFVPRVLSILATTPLHWLTLTTMVPDDLLDRPAGPDEWSATACLRHILDTERYVFPVRVRAFLAGENLVDFDPDAKGAPTAPVSAAALATEFAQLRRQSLAGLGTVTPADLARTAEHSTLGHVSLEQMLNEWVAHDLNHTVQAERSIMQPFLVASGPWRHYFSDHDLASR